MVTQNQSLKRRTLSLQSLEERNLFAGNVFAGLTGTQLSIGGDAADNQIEVTEISPNQIEVIGLSGTLVNGAPSQVFTASLIEDVVIRTGAGNDEVNVNNLSLTDTVAGNLKIFTSDGDDKIRLDKVQTTQSIELHSGAHNDSILATETGTRGKWYTNSGDGHDRVAMYRVTASDMAVDMLDGNDRLKVREAKIANNLTVKTHTENDMVRLDRVWAGNNVHVQTDQGVDTVVLRGVSAGHDVGVDSGTENDTVIFLCVKAQHDVFARLGSGDDRLSMTRVKAGNHIVGDTADGNDHVRGFPCQSSRRVFRHWC